MVRRGDSALVQHTMNHPKATFKAFCAVPDGHPWTQGYRAGRHESDDKSETHTPRGSLSSSLTSSVTVEVFCWCS